MIQPRGGRNSKYINRGVTTKGNFLDPVVKNIWKKDTAVLEKSRLRGHCFGLT